MNTEIRDVEFAKFVDTLVANLDRESNQPRLRWFDLIGWLGLGPWSTLAGLV